MYSRAVLIVLVLALALCATAVPARSGQKRALKQAKISRRQDNDGKPKPKPSKTYFARAEPTADYPKPSK
ncbi:hypothetical protein K488DRAFT_85951 [Vararia minispora EC-137]|uniref:Uncharacterized protein n=1 Tax=Vararia minispora EC-137 TaxID=1314806 RepID=A0ACB8QL08_9AGAM|nr:hypothetical protein K488DRAFT_85951 [Vararia minispora EC-137]